jgi:regulator of nonsense transcripts 2
VTRQEEEVDPENEAEFEREFAKMMAESLETRKFDRKQRSDIPMPLRIKAPRDASDVEGSEATEPHGRPTMAFSLITKKGNKQQVSYRAARVAFVATDGLLGAHV